jgi:arylsulfatase/arylsulfatase A
MRNMFRIVLAVTIFAGATGKMISADRPPNVIIVMPDDMGYGDLGATGNPVIRTPHLDRLASESAQLSHFYVSPVCSPTRACLMTGRYNYRTRVIDTFKGRSMMEPDEVTLAEALKSAGYTTGIFGKWHLGDNHPLRPQEQGFDEVLVHRGGGLAQPSEPLANQRRYTDPILFHNGQQVQTKGYCTDVYFDAAIQFMKEASEQGKPFFAYIPPNAPHGPYHDVPPELLRHYQSVDLNPVLGKNRSEKHRDTVARVYAMVENIDQNMGRLESFLRESGLKENTIVLFFTDNGPNTPRYVGPFRGMKAGVHDGGIRTCFYARWPGHFRPGHTSDRIAAHIDVTPTILAAAEADLPEVALDGRNLLPLLDGSAKDWAERTLILQTHRGNEPIAEHHVAVRSQEWKLVHPSGFGKEEMPTGVAFELYRSMDDPGESQNLADQFPEQVTRLKAIYRDWFGDVSATREDNYGPPRISLGAGEQPSTDLSLQDWRVPKNSPGWGARGLWEVDVKSKGPFHAIVQFEKPPGARQITVSVGERTLSINLTDGESVARFDPMELSRGNTTVRVEAAPAFDRQSMPRFVTFERD